MPARDAVPGSGSLYLGVDASCEGVEVPGAFLADRVGSPRGFLRQQFATAAWVIGYAPLTSEDVEVVLLDVPSALSAGAESEKAIASSIQPEPCSRPSR